MLNKSRNEVINALLIEQKIDRKVAGRLSHLTDQEVTFIADFMPDDQPIRSSYVMEILVLLSMINTARKIESSSSTGRPYVTEEIARVVCLISCLKFLVGVGCEKVQSTKIRSLLQLQTVQEIAALLDKIELEEWKLPASNTTIKTNSAIQFMESYCRELLEPPLIKMKKLGDYEQHELECNDFSWMDDGGEAYLEAIRDQLLDRYYDDLPVLGPVLDWFVATKPSFDKNQLKRGWRYFEKLSNAWHEFKASFTIYEELIAEYPSWNCLFADRPSQIFTKIEKDSPFKIIPLITPLQLLEETYAMNHCVVSYIADCISGVTRIFSMRMAESGLRKATVELSLREGKWTLVQLKGKSNLELIYKMAQSTDPLAIAVNRLVACYNKIGIEKAKKSRDDSLPIGHFLKEDAFDIEGTRSALAENRR